MAGIKSNYLKAFCFASLMWWSTDSLAALHYIRSGASGTSCADWGANACNALPATLIRGDTYYIAGGSYAGRTFDTPVAGSSIITIKGATVAEHGSDTGWTNSYSVENGNQAIWTSEISFITSFWTFDGAVGAAWDKDPTHYGFAFSSGAVQYPISIGAYPYINTSNFTISHVAATAPGGDIETMFISTGNQYGAVANVTVSNCYSNGFGNFWWATSPLTTPTQDRWTCEYNVILRQNGSALHHGEAINNNYGIMTNMIVRYTLFEGNAGSGVTGTIVANNNDVIAPLIYGNVFKDLSAGNGIITGTSAGRMISPQVYNNTFINDYSGGWIGGNTTGTPIVYNNLLYNMDASMAVSGDYNAYYSCSNVPSENHIQIGTVNPFVNLNLGDLRLSSATQAGIVLSAPFTQDVFGHTRGADGNWDRGAIEFSSASNSLILNAPTNLRVL
ncbi:MAG: hypothetical protein ACXVCP_15065 [Bdellovibrio sp.]